MSAARRMVSTPIGIGITVVGAGAAYYAYSSYMANSVPKPEQVLGDKPTWPGSGFKTLKLEEAHMVNHNTRLLRFKLPEGDKVSGLSPVSSLLTKHTGKGSWIPTFRPYTPISSKDEPGHVTFLVKKYPNGKASGHMHSLQPGQTLSVKPINELDYKPNQFFEVTCIAGGAGITPFAQLIRTVFTNPADKTKINLVYANTAEEDILLRDEFDDWEQKFPDRFKATYVVSKPPAGSEGKYRPGYVTKEILRENLPAKDQAGKSKILICGPPPMMAAVAGAKGGFGWTQGSLGGMLKELGYQKSQVQKF